LRRRKVDLVGRDARSVIGHADEALPGLLDFYFDVCSSGVDGILYKLFSHRSRPFHHLPGSDLIGDLWRQNSDHRLLLSLSAVSMWLFREVNGNGLEWGRMSSPTQAPCTDYPAVCIGQLCTILSHLRQTAN